MRELLAELRHATTGPARQIADELRSTLGATPRVSRALFTAVAHELARRRLPFHNTWTETLVAPGETWLLLGNDGGAVARIAVARRGALAPCPTVPAAAHRRAHDAVVTALRSRGAAPPIDRDDELRIIGDLGPRDDVRGDSLELPICVALLSAWLGRAPRHDVAGSAAVLPGGALAPVTELPAKLAALAFEAGGAERRVVVAAQQPMPDALPAGIIVVPTDHLLGALAEFGLEPSPAALPPRTIQDLGRRLAAFAADHDDVPPSGGWSSRAREAWNVAEALRGHDDLWGHARAMSWAMLFALHAGDVEAAETYRRSIALDVASDMGPAARIWFRIGSASTAIDRGDLALAEQLARQAVDEAASLERAIQRELLGRALGTLGRVHLHAGHYARALVPLREATAFHDEHLRAELPRSACHQATCERLAGDATSALATAERGLAVLRSFPHPMTHRFLQLERGRCLLALGRYQDARDEFDAVIASQLDDHEHPRLSALRGLARSLRQLGDASGADAALRACLAVAANTELPLMVRRVAALAAGEALLDDAGGLAAPDLRAAWNALLPEAPSDAELRHAIDRFVY